MFGSYHIWGFQSSVFWWVALAALFYFLLHHSPWGNWIFALGGDKESARNAGIPTDRLKIALFMLASMAAALSGVCETILSNSATTTTNFALIFNTIITVVVGGVLLIAVLMNDTFRNMATSLSSAKSK